MRTPHEWVLFQVNEITKQAAQCRKRNKNAKPSMGAIFCEISPNSEK